MPPPLAHIPDGTERLRIRLGPCNRLPGFALCIGWPTRWHTNICSHRGGRLGNWGARIRTGSRGSKGLHLAITTTPQTGTATVPPASPLAVLVLVRHAACFAALLVGWAAWRDYAQDAHRLQSQREAFAAVGGGDVEGGQLLHALQAVADRVAVGEELLGGPGDVAVGVQEGLERPDQLGLVLLVVGPRAGRRSRRRSPGARAGPRSSPAAAAGRRRSPRTRARAGRAPPPRWRRAGPRRPLGAGRPGRPRGGCAPP